MAFLLCVEFSDYDVMRKVGSCVSGYLIGRYNAFEFIVYKGMKWTNIGIRWY
ncbi:hypothetical protein P0F25_003534, partial [Vibrio metschnikovii]|nr:hypothetical protein [Vibrio metschnikovii]